MGGVHVLIPTHTPRYLDIVLVGLGLQVRRADTVIVSCDTDDGSIGSVIEHWASRLKLPVWWVRRRHHGGERLCQVRNNGVRHLTESLGVERGRLVVLDGDMFAPPRTLALHEELGRDADLVYPYRVNLPRDVSEGLLAEELFAGRQSLVLSDSDRSTLAARQRRSQRQLLFRKLRLGALHKPKLLGGHFSVSLDLYVRLNGFDERYQGWGFKDDEFAYRAARLGARCRVAVEQIPAFHLWHESRQAPGRMAELPTAARFRSRRRLPLVAEAGLRNPLPQHPVEVTRFGPN